MHIAHRIAYVLVIIGALNWGIVGVTAGEFNLVTALLGSVPLLENLVYLLVGLSALVLIISRRHAHSCAHESCTCDVEINKSGTPEAKTE